MAERTIKALHDETIKASKWLVAEIQNKAPRHIAPHIIAKNSYSENSSSITIYVKKIPVNVDGRFGTADALAQEYGSGVHAGKGKYPITPKRGKFLAFPWDVNVVGANRLPDGRILLKKVMHPGIAPYNGEGYMRVGFASWKASENGYKAISYGFKTAIAADVKTSLSKLASRFGK